MTKAIVVTSQKAAFLVETDDSVEVPPHFATARHSPTQAEANDFQDVVDLGEIGRDFSDIKQLIVSCCNDLYEAIENIPKPEKVAIEFGIKLAGEAGIPMLTKASGEANFKVSVEWKKQ